MPPQNSCPVQRVQSYLAIRAFASIQASGLTMSNDQQATKMLTSIAKPTGGFEYAGEYYIACRAFLSGTDPSMPSKTLIQPNELKLCMSSWQRLSSETSMQSSATRRRDSIRLSVIGFRLRQCI